MIKSNEFLDYLKTTDASFDGRADNKKRIAELVQRCHKRDVSLHQLFVLLIENFERPGIRNFIVNFLFDMDVRELLFYIPQFSYLNLVFPSSFLLKFLIEGCSKSSEFFVLVK